MTENEAITALSGLVAADVGDDWDALASALAASRLVDETGLAPVDEGWTPTWDLNYAAFVFLERRATLMVLRDEGGVSSFTSEGSSFTMSGGSSAQEIRQVAYDFREKSTAGAGTVTVIDLIPQGGLRPRSWDETVTPRD